MSTHYRLGSQLDSSFDDLVQRLQALQAGLEEEKGQCWMLGADDQTSSHRLLLNCLLDIWYLDGQDGRATRSYPGLVAVSSKNWQLLGEVNHAKVSFSHQLDLIRREFPDELPEARKRLAERHQALHAHLVDQGLARLHLKQTWRQLPGCELPVEQIRFSWYSSGRSIRRISVKEAEYRLLQMNTDAAHIEIQLKKLAGLSPGEPLAQVQSQAPLMRANLFFSDNQPGQPERKAMNIAMPLFLLNDEGRLPAFNQPSQEPPEARTRARRSDTKLEDEPFLPSLRVYRYR
ncbi:DNA replication terminus site binding protein [Marinospirillum celere]|uniref:DNA replication terminus site binding protein n=1 Tax=Marinospirillum celere TaxID=1122252 RepID=A0A1I1E7W9_9GAMM|nr:DNA replication terminus site-binding protein [Marinospirillum celere]SFB83164.1 DNA replication terminus site binding protein [Marinospirillum celere]